MRKYLFSGLIGVILLVILACGDDATSTPVPDAATQAPGVTTQAPEVTTQAPGVTTQAPVATEAPTGGQAPTASDALKAYADAHAGGPGAVYAGDINQLVGPAGMLALGDDDGNVPLEALQTHMYIYEGEYYQNLLKKAKLTNPTELVSTGESITIQHACINRATGQCRAVEPFWVDNLAERTNGQLTMQVTSFPELGIAGPDITTLTRDGTLEMVEFYLGYIAGEVPEIEITGLWGIWPSIEVAYKAVTAANPAVDQVLVDATDGGVVVAHLWIQGVNQYIWSQEPLDSVEVFQGLKTRSHAAALTDWIEGMGADAQFVAFAEVYTALERGIIDAGITGAGPGLGQRWYEVTKYINGPLAASASVHIVMNKDAWDRIPADLQQILLEEGAKAELEALRVMAILDTMEFQRNVNAGLVSVEFPQEVQDYSFTEAVIGNVVPGWIKRVGVDNPIIDAFNEKVGPWVNIRVEADGSVTNLRPQAMAEAATLKAYADANAGGPGAVYAGDITQMVGPASRVALGNDDGLIPLKELQEHVYIYETEEYQNLLIKAGVWNPTELVSSGESVKLQVACINRTLGRCQVIEDFLVPNLAERTNGQVDLDITSFPELGIAGPDTISLVRDGTLGMVEIYTGYVAGEIPAVEIIALFGSWPTREVAYLAINSLLPDLDEIIVDASEGVVVGHVWGPGEDQFIWSQKPLDSVEAFKNIKVRSHASALSDWLEGMGADAQFLAFAEVYTALERGILDAAVTGAGPGLGQRWYEVAKYINGPLPGAMPTTLVINQDVWAEIPADLQQIIIEEGARNELESLRFIAMMDTQDFIRNVEAGLEFVQFPPEVQEHSLNEAFIGQVLPSWINRLGGADRPIIELFNKKVGSRVGVFIEADGTVLKVPVTKTN